MNRTPFNDDWRVRPKVNAFMELVGGGAQPWVAVRLPHDAMIDGTRDPAASPAERATSPAGVWEYQKTFVVHESDPRQADPGRVRGRLPRRVGCA